MTTSKIAVAGILALSHCLAWAHSWAPRLDGARFVHCEAVGCLEIVAHEQMVMDGEHIALGRGTVRWRRGTKYDSKIEIVDGTLNLNAKVFSFTTANKRTGLGNLRTMQYLLF